MQKLVSAFYIISGLSVQRQREIKHILIGLRGFCFRLSVFYYLLLKFFFLSLRLLTESKQTEFTQKAKILIQLEKYDDAVSVKWKKNNKCSR